MTAAADTHDRGSIAVELAILMPAFIALIVLAVVAGRLVIAQSAIDLAAHDAARTASLARTADTARPAALAAARNTLAEQGIRCLDLTVTVDVSQFQVPVGQPAFVRADLACTVSFSDVAIPGAPGNRVLTAWFTSPLDQYRVRT
ncbi:MAG: pilus assembly protein [Dactylosporangium sp.]|nr:pilus assembly protein [Dactylosporangium sp.]NNJ63498.1 pilus assembly protein [Dactylosporangium sp.]